MIIFLVIQADDVCVGVSPEHVQKQVKDLLSHHDPTNSGSITQEEYLMWTLHNPLSTALLDIIFQASQFSFCWFTLYSYIFIIEKG